MDSSTIYRELTTTLEAEFNRPLTDADTAGLNAGLTGSGDRPLFARGAAGVEAGERYSRAVALGLANAERYQAACVAEGWR